MDYGLIRAMISILSFVVMISMAIAGWIAFKKITSNHLFHLDNDMKELKVDVRANAGNIAKIQTDVAVIVTKLDSKK